LVDRSHGRFTEGIIMARMPGVTWVGEKSPRRRMSRYDLAIIHTIVGRAPAHAAHFSTSGTGKIWQSRDTKYRSAASLNGNHRSISIENEDHGPQFSAWNVNDGHAVPGFTDAQMDAIAEILAWAHKTHGIPLVMAPNSRPSSKGIAYHRMGIDGNWGGYKYGGRVSGGELWTSARGKVCPGDRRISQIPEIIRRAQALVHGGDWLDMASEDDVRRIMREEVDRGFHKWGKWLGEWAAHLVWRVKYPNHENGKKYGMWQYLITGYERSGDAVYQTQWNRGDGGGLGPGISGRVEGAVEKVLGKVRGTYGSGSDVPVKLNSPGAHRYAWGAMQENLRTQAMLSTLADHLDSTGALKAELTAAAARVEMPEGDAPTDEG